jgi:DNA transposition AAA+ family ATPase
MTRKKLKTPDISMQLRRLIENCGMTQYRLSKETDVARSTLSKFLNDPEFSLSLNAIDKIGRRLGWRIVAEAPRPEAVAQRGTTNTTRGRKGKKARQ